MCVEQRSIATYAGQNRSRPSFLHARTGDREGEREPLRPAAERGTAVVKLLFKFEIFREQRFYRPKIQIFECTRRSYAQAVVVPSLFEISFRFCEHSIAGTTWGRRSTPTDKTPRFAPNRPGIFALASSSRANLIFLR